MASAPLMGSQVPSERVAPDYTASDGLDAAKLVRIGGKYYLPGDVVPPEKHLETIRAYLEKFGFAYRQDIADLLHIQRKQCALILHRMVERGELAQSGQKYYLPQSEGRKAE